ncbi:phage conserved hypothetical protein BR0599 [Chelatococcus sambhunathii]|uniref:Bacteriophage phiJL001 Gp84 C-terminal domain-containing protein n=1 Tax=Chelatococcus sambhunathii TaxID=363953 RepID=A0ABM9U474_9HYPH|nr:DUF2163 domain-containing protein [Chelatococcus sambhunathii]CUA87964.1 phage conserved hypothetical protein BR0599 [Chelatococcus sambhunathii]
MRDIDPAFAEHLAASATTLCHCWKLLRRDGAVFGFTDHDRDLAFAGVTFAARSGLEPSEVSAELGFAVATSEVAGALSAVALTEADIVGGLYDDATVETWLVNWADPEAQRLLVDVASIGEIKRTDHAFLAELRGIMHRLDQPQGRLYSLACAADLGDVRCGVDLTLPAFRAEGAVTATDGRLVVQARDLGDHADGWFTGGRLVWTGGANAGAAVEVKHHRRDQGVHLLTLWHAAPATIGEGDAFTVTAGCDKRHATCRDRFSNTVNFRGFPHMPGNDFVVTYPREGEGHDGGSFFR